jgi:hypothetical protein
LTESSKPSEPNGRERIVGRAEALAAGAIAIPFGELRVHADWDVFWVRRWVPYITVAAFHQLPLWNPWRCGGMPMLAEVQSGIVSPFFVLEFIFGFARGVHLEIPLHLAIAWAGGYILGRALGQGRIAAAACGSIFPASSWFPLHLAEGHLWILPAAYLPWICLLIIISVERRRTFPAAIAGLFAAMIFYEGGPYLIGQAGLIVAVIAIAAAIRQRNWRPLLVILAFGAFAAGFGAIKLIPTAIYMHSHPRPGDFDEFNGLSTMATAFLSRFQDYYRLGPRWQFHEYGAYVGTLGAAFAIFGMFSREPRKWTWIAMLAFFVALSIGAAGVSFSPAALIHHVPPFPSERVPSRFYIPAVLAIAVLAGFGIDTIIASMPRAGAVVAVMLLLIDLADAWIVGTPNLRYALRGIRVEPSFSATAPFRQVTVPYDATTLDSIVANRGVANDKYCVAGAEPSAVLLPADRGYRGEEFLVPADGRVTRLEWSPNQLAFDIDVSAPATLAINQNFDRYWRLGAGDGTVVDAGGLLAVRVPPGKQEVVLRYRDLSWLGAIVTMLTVVIAIMLRRLESSK